MPTVRFSSMRATPLLIVALAAMLLIFAGSDTATAHEFNPSASGSVSDPTPGAHADLTVSFALAGGSLPTDDPPTVLFIPRQWGIHTDAPIGAIAGSLDALATIGILGMPCTLSATFAPTLYVASTDPSNPTSALDLEGHPGGVGYSGQFVPDPDDPDGLYGGITRYPDFLNRVFTPDLLRESLVRLWGGQNVLVGAISMNVLIFEPGQLPGYPPSLGYPVVFVLMDPRGQWGPLRIISDLCPPLSAVNTQFGISQDNPHTPQNEGGYPLLTNPRGQGEYAFTLETTSMPDADYPPEARHGDGLENVRDSCPFDCNVGDSDGDQLDDACDPEPLTPSPTDPSGLGVYDEDQDNYGNWLDNCPLMQNGIEVLGCESVAVDGFVFIVCQYGDLIGPDNQADTDGDDIGDACEGSEHGGPLSDAEQCANDLDDDADGAVNDGCPRVGDTGESGPQCDNDIDDDGDGFVNDGCPAVDAEGERFIPTGRIYTVGLTFTIPIYRHGVKLDNLGGPKKVKQPGARDYSVAVSNVSDTYPEEIQVALRVLPAGCATVNGEMDSQDEAVVPVRPLGSGVADFTVDWTGCPVGEYIVQADACHAGDPTVPGFFGVGLCPGVWDGIPDTNPKHDVAMSIIVNVR